VEKLVAGLTARLEFLRAMGRSRAAPNDQGDRGPKLLAEKSRDMGFIGVAGSSL
jgi:hypothetical protein